MEQVVVWNKINADNCPVLQEVIATDGDSIFIGNIYYSNFHKCWYCLNEDIHKSLFYITHWMHKPILPKMEE